MFSRSPSSPLRASSWTPLLALLPLACGDGPGDVLLVTVDTLRSDHVGLYGYARDTTPHIDRWFADGALFANAYSTDANTSPSIASILSGRLPQEHRVRLFYQLIPHDVELVPDLLPPGYQTAAFVSSVVLTDEAIGFARRFDHYDDFVDERESIRPVFERRARRTTDAALSWLELGRDRSRPLFLWVHYIDPHGPYRPPEDWPVRFRSVERREIPARRVPVHIREPGVRDGNAYVDRYDAEIAYVDSEIGRLLEDYARLSPIDDALVILTADHGEGLMEHEEWFSHGYHVYEEIIRVPLLLRGPGVARGRFEAPASGVDIAATILRFAGVEPGPAMADVDLRRAASLDPERIVYSEGNQRGTQWRSAIRGARKLVLGLRGPGPEVVAERVYDLARDPGELAPMRPSDPDALSRALAERIRSDPDPSGVPTDARKGIQPNAPKVAPSVSAKDLERLRALGYAE